ncbi:hypothetical protein CsSME_00033654 [Camellia sinensis var. sinensis]|uniref:putative pentatricopeptide repeat-containing protein At1g12700, mitochondrial n=1 Tax=Camellia sinensis TaxID=4442 RepID=UPI001036055A|nr:putative pentatricopeptide repeat-containing protein At1g12700, mitochondrial [Camellia sinensis]
MHNILIHRFCKDGKLEMAKNLFGKLHSRGLRPNVNTYTMMIGGFCEQGLLGEAKELLMTIEETGCLPNYATYNVMVCGFLKANDYSEANILVEKMIGTGFSVDASTLATIVDLLSAKGQDPTLFQMIKKLVPQDNTEGIC